jgi:hypothetical protein
MDWASSRRSVLVAVAVIVVLVIGAVAAIQLRDTEVPAASDPQPSGPEVKPPESASPIPGAKEDTVPTVPDTTKGQKKLLQVRKRARVAGIAPKHAKRYKITIGQAREIRRAKTWSRRSKVRTVRRCESGGNYRTHSGNGYFGAYQFAAGTWASVGGRRYAGLPHKAPKFAQDHMAYRLYQRSGWRPWGCA